MKEQILQSFAIRMGSEFNPVLMEDYVSEAMCEVSDYINYGDDPLPNSLIGVVKKVAMFKFNTFKSTGIKSESYSGVSQTYLEDALSLEDMKKLRSKRRLKR